MPPRLRSLARERRRRLAAIPRYDRYIAEAEGDLTLQAFWRNLRRQELEDLQRLGFRLDREREWFAAGDRATTTARHPREPGVVGHPTPA